MSWGKVTTVYEVFPLFTCLNFHSHNTTVLPPYSPSPPPRAKIMLPLLRGTLLSKVFPVFLHYFTPFTGNSFGKGKTRYLIRCHLYNIYVEIVYSVVIILRWCSVAGNGWEGGWLWMLAMWFSLVTPALYDKERYAEITTHRDYKINASSNRMPQRKKWYRCASRIEPGTFLRMLRRTPLSYTTRWNISFLNLRNTKNKTSYVFWIVRRLTKAQSPRNS
jgi:hypothetical protein